MQCSASRSRLATVRKVSLRTFQAKCVRIIFAYFLGTVFFLENGPKTWAFAALSFPLSLMLVGLELFVAALQAFIFAVLSASYIGQAMAEGH